MPRMSIRDAGQGAARAPQGEPKGPRVPISVRLSPDEYSFIALRADLEGWSPSTFIRKSALSAASRRYPNRHLGRDLLARAVATLTSEISALRAALPRGSTAIRAEVERVEVRIHEVREILRRLVR